MKRTQKQLLDDMEEVPLFHQEQDDIPELVKLIEEATAEIHRLNTVETNLREQLRLLHIKVEDLEYEVQAQVDLYHG